MLPHLRTADSIHTVGKVQASDLRRESPRGITSKIAIMAGVSSWCPRMDLQIISLDPQHE